jgi:hypothetical protein
VIGKNTRDVRTEEAGGAGDEGFHSESGFRTSPSL